MIPYQQYETGGGLAYHHPHHPHAYPGHGVPGGPQDQGELPRYSRLLFKLPRVVPNQKEKFESEEIFKKHTREGEVRYTLYRDRPALERQAKFQAGCRDGHTEISFSGTGLVVLLNWMTPPLHHHGMDHKMAPSPSYCDFNRERGRVHICTSFILNGVCVRWRGWLDLERLEGAGSLELDEEMARREEALLTRHIQLVHQKIRDCEDRYRSATDLQTKKLPGYV